MKLTKGHRRMLVAVPLSMLLHLILVLLLRPEYRQVADYAVDMEIMEVQPGPTAPPASEPEPEPEPEPEAEPEPEVKKEKAPAAAAEPVPEAPAVPPPAPKEEVVEAAAEGGVDGGTGKGTGICLHNLFDYGPDNPSWLLYVSLNAFRGTTYENELSRTFLSFDIGRRIKDATGLNPTTDVEALLVATDNIFDWRTFRVVATYDSGEEGIAGRIKAREAKNPDFEWLETQHGYEAVVPGSFRWHLVGSGRVLAVTHEPKKAPATTDLPLEKGTPPIKDSPLGEGAPSTKAPPLEKGGQGDLSLSKTDAGVPVAIAEPVLAETGMVEKKKTRSPGMFPDWPRQVACLTLDETQSNDSSDDKDKPKAKSKPKPKKAEDGEKALLDKMMKQMIPDGEGHWPVALLSTRDSRAIGLGRRAGRRFGFQHAVIRGYFTDPVRIEGVIQFKGNPDQIALLAQAWQQEAAAGANDPFLALAGVSSLLKSLKITAQGDKILINLSLKENQVISTLLFLQLQGKVLERQLKSD